MKWINWLKSPVAVIGGMVAGVLIGLFGRGIVPVLEPIGTIYLSLLQMCVIPIMVSAVVVSIGKLLSSGSGRSFISRILLTLGLLLVGISLLSIVASMVIPGVRNPSADVKQAIGGLISSDSSAALGFKSIFFYGKNEVAANQNSIVDFLVNIVPKNIFEALSNNDNLKIIFFFLVFGIVAAFLSEKVSAPIFRAFDAIYQAFQTLIGFMMYFLPFGLCAMTAVQFSQFGISLFLSTLILIALIIGISVLIFLVSFVVICVKCQCTPMAQLKALGETIFIALGTKNSFAAIPSALSGFTEQLGLDGVEVNAVLPLGISLCRFGNILIFSVAAVFACGLYGVKLSLGTVVLIMLNSIFAGIASSGAPGVVARSMIAMVLSPLYIPAQSIVVILTMIDPIIDPFSTITNVYPNCAATAIVAHKDKII